MTDLTIKITKTIEVEEEISLASFPQNKYTKWYANLINTRMNQPREKFKTEKHHIFPTSIFGKNTIMINLTIREHYIAHLILVKMYKSLNNQEYRKMTMAIAMFSSKGVIRNSKMFENNRCSYWSHPENRELQSQKRKKHLSNPENYKKLCKVNKKLSNTKEWKEQRSQKQKELSSNKEYTDKRIKAMSSPESIAKSKATIKSQIQNMTDEERKKRFSHPCSEEEKIRQSKLKKGLKKYINKETNEVKMSKIKLSLPWLLWASLSKEQKYKYNNKDKGI